MDARCNGAVCGQLQTQSAESAMKCLKSKAVEDDLEGCKSNILLRCIARVLRLINMQGLPRFRVLLWLTKWSLGRVVRSLF